MIRNGNSRHDTDISFEKARGRQTLDAPSRLACPALLELLAAFEYSEQVGRDVWDFAVSVRAMYASGLGESDLRWLICKELVEHARDVTCVGDEVRQFQKTHPLVFTTQNCFVLTERGCDFVRSAIGQHVALPNAVTTFVEQEDAQPANLCVSGSHDSTTQPHWDPVRHELRLSDVLIKQFKWPAVNQEMVLATFQEESWPSRIDDPLPPQPDQDSKRRLSDTIKCLNRKQKSSLIRFRGDGTGEGVIWEIAERQSRA